ncbi:hypothetical protein [Nocardia sp. NPDC051463]|uniref:hypothetical protein n=1 Tax=Nocardia sp. NPDC051463 TaxID=3154845 RepID=UPI00342409E8
MDTEIKINIAGDFERSREILRLPKGKPRRVRFLEITSGHRSFVPLLDAGIILRLRSEKNSDESNVKLRPCVPDQLVGRWTANFHIDPDFSYKVEGDWSGANHVLAASAVAKLQPGLADRVADGNADPTTVFGDIQRQFLAQCGEIPDALQQELTVLGAIEATKWRDVPLEGFDVGDVNAERWIVNGFDFLELSIRVADGNDPEPVQRNFEAAVGGTGLSISDVRESKTRIILESLAESASRVH